MSGGEEFWGYSTGEDEKVIVFTGPDRSLSAGDGLLREGGLLMF